jgi:hypothetical protein
MGVSKQGDEDRPSVASAALIDLTLAKVQIRIIGKVDPSVLHTYVSRQAHLERILR